MFFIDAERARPCGPLPLSAQPIEFGGVVVGQLPTHFDRKIRHLPFDGGARVGPHTVGMWIVRGPQQMSVAKERDQRHRNAILLEGRVYLALEEFARLGFERNAALVGPELLGFPEPPMAVVELLDEPG